jgi:hypothetical protein
MTLQVTKNLTIVLFISLISNDLVANECTKKSNNLAAEYEIQHYKNSEKIAQNKLSLYRYNNQLGHFFHNKKYGDWWQKNSKNQLMLVRYFPEFKHAIEYQADEISGIDNNQLYWQKKWQIITADALNKMHKLSTEGQGCQQVTLYRYKKHDKQLKLRWLAGFNLLEGLEEYHGGQLLMRWRLNNVNTQYNHVANYVSSIENYQTTDYADIGDNESIPFLSKMINQGFSNHKADIDLADNQTHHHDH